MIDPSLFVDSDTVYITHYRMNVTLPKPAGGYRFAVLIKLPVTYFLEPAGPDTNVDGQ